MITTLDGLLLMLGFLALLLAVPTGAIFVALLLVRKPRHTHQSPESPVPTHEVQLTTTEAHLGVGGASGQWRRWTLLSFAVVGAALSGGAVAWRIYTRTGWSPSSQDVADLPMTLPFVSGLGFFGGLLIGVLVVFLGETLIPRRKEPK